MEAFVEIDGSMGEGGGQILRTSLALSAVTGRPLRIRSIRSARRNPGLGHQHLACARAAAAVTGGTLEGDAIGSLSLLFRPGAVRPGRYTFQVPSAGSSLLVLQTILPVLASAPEASEVEISGGTHNPMAPPFEFIEGVFLPAIRRAGFRARVDLLRHGFYPRGGGRIRAPFEAREPAACGIRLVQRGPLAALRGRAIVSALPRHIADREARILREAGIDEVEIIEVGDPAGPGNAVLIHAEFARIRAGFAAFGERGKPAEKVAREAVRAWRAYQKVEGAVDPHLADQLPIYTALCGEGEYTACEITLHARTNFEVVERFLPVRFEIDRAVPGCARIRTRQTR
ncbi:MAG: RNA 3'-terminal phosphate cyclase [Planctomycetes bacterium]|nr:RNA 3'-terminal phosphate cyclase [Planctomycetota bacterium]